jgi:hypothetical protein
MTVRWPDGVRFVRGPGPGRRFHDVPQQSTAPGTGFCYPEPARIVLGRVALTRRQGSTRSLAGFIRTPCRVTPLLAPAR